MIIGPINQKDVLPLRDRSFLEGTPASYLASYTSTLNSGAINQSVGTFQLPVNHAIYADAVTVGSNLAIDLQVALTYGSTLGGVQGTQNDVVRAALAVNSTYEKRIDALLTQPMSGTNSQIGQVAVRRLRNTDGTAATVSATDVSINSSLSGRLMYDDTNFGADKLIKFVGDSIFRGVGRTDKANCFDWKIRTFYADRGLNVRGMMKATSGSTTSNHETWRAMGWHNEEKVDLLVYQLGTNDAGGSVADTVYGSNLTEFIQMKQRKWPTAKMLILGVHPLENATSESYAALYRTKAQDIVSALTDTSVFFCNLGLLGSGFSSVAGNYASTDTAGSRVHPSDAGDALIWDGNGSTFAGLGAFLEANIPAI